MLFIVGFALAAMLAVILIPRATNAQVSCTVDQALLDKIYSAIFHRPTDAGASGYVGQGVDFVLDQVITSNEHQAYTGLFTATKAFEEFQREAGDASAADVEVYKDYIDSALSVINEWAQTLPEQARANAVIGPTEAKTAIQTAYDNLDATAQAAAQSGLFQAQDVIGVPSSLPNPSGF